MAALVGENVRRLRGRLAFSQFSATIRLPHAEAARFAISTEVFASPVFQHKACQL
jgi:hypothetical protein